MRGFFKLFIFSFFLLVLEFIIIPSFSSPADAQFVGCWVTKIGNPSGPSPTFPPDCITSNHWPFAKKDPSQFRRTDAGWDLQENHIEDADAGKTWIYAVADGTLHKQCCTGGGYGPHYPYEDLTTQINYRGPHKAIFYGHVIMIDSLEGQKVKAGQKIAWTGPRGCSLPGHTYYDNNGNPSSWCGNGGAYWLEIGWGDSQPEGRVTKCVNTSIDPYLNPNDACAWTQAGQDMKDWLLGKPE